MKKYLPTLGLFLLFATALSTYASIVGSGVSGTATEIFTSGSATCNPNVASVYGISRDGWIATADSVTFGAVAGAVNGSGAWISSGTAPHWIAVNFGSPQTFNAISIMPNQTNAVSRTYTLDVSTDGITYTIGVETSPTYAASTVARQVWNLSTSYTKQYIRINAAAGGTSGSTSMVQLLVGTQAAAGNVAIGQVEVAAVAITNNTSVSISSTRVTSWTLDQNPHNTDYLYVWHGTVTSNGAESISVTAASSTSTGIVCSVYSSNPASNSVSTILSSTSIVVGGTSDIIEIAYGLGLGAKGSFITRQSGFASSATWLTLGDFNGTSGTYSSNFSGTPNAIVMLASSPGNSGVQRHR